MVHQDDPALLGVPKKVVSPSFAGSQTGFQGNLTPGACAPEPVLLLKSHTWEKQLQRQLQVEGSSFPAR